MPKKIKILLFIFIIILIVFLVGKNIINEKKEPDTNTTKRELMSEDVIVVKNSIAFFRNYYNKISAKEIQENWDNFARLAIYEYSSKIKNENQIKEYYNNNTEKIYKDTGISNFETFESLITKIVGVTNYETIELKKMELKEPVTYENGMTKAILVATYNENLIVEFGFSVMDQKNEDGVFVMYY